MVKFLEQTELLLIFCVNLALQIFYLIFIDEIFFFFFKDSF